MKLEMFIMQILHHYNHDKYWRMREKVVNYRGGFFNKIRCSWYLFRIKRMDAFNNASLGTHLGFGAVFASRPHFPHGIQNVIISHMSKFGQNCTILHSVTVGNGHGGSPTIGDNVEIGAGAVIIGGITIGNNCRIGAGCIVAEDIPENCTVVMPHPRIIHKNNNNSIKYR